MMKRYVQFKRWVEQKSVQKTLNTAIIAFLLIFVIVGLVYANTNSHVLSRVLGVSIAKPTPTLIPTTIPLPTEVPTDTPIPQQTYQQSQSAQQAPGRINCNVTAYVPEYKPVYIPFTPKQCAYEQQYALTLWNNAVKKEQELQIPQSDYTYPSGNANVPPPPAIGGQPVLQQPAAPNGNFNLPITNPKPTQTCSVVWSNGVQVPVCY